MDLHLPLSDRDAVAEVFDDLALLSRFEEVKALSQTFCVCKGLVSGQELDAKEVDLALEPGRLVFELAEALFERLVAPAEAGDRNLVGLAQAEQLVDLAADLLGLGVEGPEQFLLGGEGGVGAFEDLGDRLLVEEALGPVHEDRFEVGLGDLVPALPADVLRRVARHVHLGAADADGQAGEQVEGLPARGPAVERPEFGPPVTLGKENPLRLEDLIEAAKSGLAVKGDATSVQLKGKSAESWSVKIVDKKGHAIPARVGTGAKESEARPSELNASKKEGEPGNAGEPRQKKEIRLVMRSPEGVLYHLGQIVRIERKLRETNWQGVDERTPCGAPVCMKDGRPLFTADPRRVACRPCGISVTYCGEVYAVSGDPDADESMHVLSLLTQVIGLQKSADELPKSGIVTLVGK